jgi:hypothetical protein
MISNFISLVGWGNGVLQAVIMFAVFLVLIVVLVVFMMGGKKNDQ